jgi:hypothetical protein
VQRVSSVGWEAPSLSLSLSLVGSLTQALRPPAPVSLLDIIRAQICFLAVLKGSFMEQLPNGFHRTESLSNPQPLAQLSHSGKRSVIFFFFFLTLLHHPSPLFPLSWTVISVRHTRKRCVLYLLWEYRTCIDYLHRCWSFPFLPTRNFPHPLPPSVYCQRPL